MNMNKINYIRLFDKYLAHTATKEEICMLIEWLRRNRSSNDWLTDQWQTTEVHNNPKSEATFMQIRSKLNLDDNCKTVKRNQLKVRYLAQIAAVLLVLVLIGWTFIFQHSGTGMLSDQVVHVGKGQKVNLELFDGTSVWVNSESRLQYGKRFNKKERVLQLEGEAFFEVAPDKNRPFIVEMKNLSVKALGTSFNIKSYENEDQIIVDLLTGKVEAFNSSENMILEPNQRLVYDKESGLMEMQLIDNIKESNNWIKGKSNLSFQSESFENIARMLERQYNVEIVFKPESLKKISFTGTLPNSSIENILKMISFSIPISYEINEGLVIISGK